MNETNPPPQQFQGEYEWLQDPLQSYWQVHAPRPPKWLFWSNLFSISRLRQCWGFCPLLQAQHYYFKDRHLIDWGGSDDENSSDDGDDISAVSTTKEPTKEPIFLMENPLRLPASFTKVSGDKQESNTETTTTQPAYYCEHDERPPLAKRNRSVIIFKNNNSKNQKKNMKPMMMATSRCLLRTSYTDSTTASSTISRHKRENASIPSLDQIYASSSSCLPPVVDCVTCERRVSDYGYDDDDLKDDDCLDLFDMSSTSSSSSSSRDNCQEGHILPVVSYHDNIDEDEKQQWVNQHHQQDENDAFFPEESPICLPQSPVPSMADPQPLFCVGWAAVQFLKDRDDCPEADDDDDDAISSIEESIVFVQLIRQGNDDIAIQLTNDTTHKIVPYDPYIRSLYEGNTYSLGIGNTLRIIPIPMSNTGCCRRRRYYYGTDERCSSLVLHDSVLFLQFGLDAAARSAMLSARSKNLHE